MRTSIILVALILMISMVPTAQSGSPEQMDEVGAVFGGANVNASSTGNMSLNFSEMPAIVEDYTATWCTNCVDVEHALDDVEETNHMQQYHFHRFIGESEDPLGSQEGDERWIERYDQRLPPTVIFNGTLRQIGSVPASDSLQEDYNANLQNSLEMGMGTSSLGWSPGSNGSASIVTWNLVMDMTNLPDNSTVKSSIWIVEDLAYFPDGGNGEEYYHESVRAIVELGEDLSGSKEVSLPAAYDGDDLEIHLIHEIVLPEVVDEDPAETSEPEKEDEEDSSLPSLSLVAALSVVMMAAITVQRKQQ